MSTKVEAQANDGTIEASAQVENTGEQQSDATGNWLVEGQQFATSTVQIPAGQNDTIPKTLGDSSQLPDGDSLQVTFEIPDHSTSDSTTVDTGSSTTPPNFNYNFSGGDKQVAKGQTASFTLNIQNNGGSGSADIVAENSQTGESYLTTPVQLSSGGSTTETVNVPTDNLSAGNTYDIVVKESNTQTVVARLNLN